MRDHATYPLTFLTYLYMPFRRNCEATQDLILNPGMRGALRNEAGKQLKSCRESAEGEKGQ